MKNPVSPKGERGFLVLNLHEGLTFYRPVILSPNQTV